MPRILVVDDDPLVSSAILAWLEAKGHEVIVANGGVSGLAALSTGSFDIMIVDVFMPGMNNFESIRTFHQHAVTVPLIAISGYVLAEQRHTPAADFLRMALEFGATRCLRKPFRPATLLAAIDDCLCETASRARNTA